MLRKILIAFSIVLAVVITPAIARYNSFDFHGAKNFKHEKGSHGSNNQCSHKSKGSKYHKGSKGSNGSYCSNENEGNICDTYTKKVEKAYNKYLEYKKKYTSCKHNVEGYVSTCKKRQYGSNRKHGSKGSHEGSRNTCKKYKKKADKVYKRYLSYEAKRKNACQTSLPPVALEQNVTTIEETNISFVLRGTDSNGQVLTIATVSIVVTPVNDAPFAQEQNLTTPEDTNVSITLAGSDEDNDTLVYSVVTQPTHGALSGTAPNLVYTPNVNYNGSDSFTFKVNDGTVDSIEATVSLVITPVNDAPVAVDDNISMDEDTQVVQSKLYT